LLHNDANKRAQQRIINTSPWTVEATLQGHRSRTGKRSATVGGFCACCRFSGNRPSTLWGRWRRKRLRGRLLSASWHQSGKTKVLPELYKTDDDAVFKW